VLPSVLVTYCKSCGIRFWIWIIWDLFQGLQMGIALPSILLNIQGAAGGVIVLALVGFGILLPLLVAVVYLSRSSKYTGNYVMHQTLSTYYYFIKPSLAPRFVSGICRSFRSAIEFFLRTCTNSMCSWGWNWPWVCLLRSLIPPGPK
jgi:hypothetical protein